MSGVVQCVVGHLVAFHGAVEVDHPEVDLSPLGRVVDAGREDFVVAYAGLGLLVSCESREEVDGVHLVTDVDLVVVRDAVGRAAAIHVALLAMDVAVLLAMDVVAHLEMDVAVHRADVDHLVIDAEDVVVHLVDAVDHLGRRVHRCPAADVVRFEHVDRREHHVKSLDGVVDRPAYVAGHQVPREAQLEDDRQLVMGVVHSANVGHLDADRLAAVTYADRHLAWDARRRLVQSVVQFAMDVVRQVDVLVVTDVVVVHVEVVAHATDRAVRVCETVADMDYAAIVMRLGSKMVDPLGWVPVAVALGCSEATATPFYFSV